MAPGLTSNKKLVGSRPSLRREHSYDCSRDKSLSSNKKLVVTSASLLVTSALLVVTRS